MNIHIVGLIILACISVLLIVLARDAEDKQNNTFYTVTCPTGVYKHIRANGITKTGKEIILPLTCVWEEE